jgi:hypothetical protein
LNGEQDRDGDEHGQAAEYPRDDVGGAQARGVGDKAAGQGTKRHRAPAEHAVDAVGSLVIVTASNGSAATKAPSPVLLIALAHHMLQ